MIPQRAFGMALLVIGVVLLVIGLNSSHSTVDQLSNSFTGRFTDHTMWYIVGGIGTGAVGLVLLSGFLGKRA